MTGKGNQVTNSGMRTGWLSRWVGSLRAVLKLGTSASQANRRLLGQAHIKLDKIARRTAGVARQLEKSATPAMQADKGTQILLCNSYRELAHKGIFLPFHEVEFRNFSQTGEDGILHYIFSLVGTTDRRSVEICAGTGIQCNSANLIIHHGWHSLLVDGSEANVRKGRKFFREHPDTQLRVPKFVRRWVDRESVNAILSEQGFTGEIDLLCLDLDGVDYWIWEALTVASPRVVVVEVNTTQVGVSVTVPYSPGFKATWIPLTDSDTDEAGQALTGPSNFHERYAVYHGASLSAFVKLARVRGYRLIGANNTGFNAFFMRDDVGAEEFPEVSAESCAMRQDPQRLARALAKLSQYPWQEV